MSDPNAHASSSKHHSKSSKKKHISSKEKDSSTKHKHSSHGKHKSSKEKDDKKDKSTKEKATPFEHRSCRMRLSVPPKYAADWLTGVREMLDAMLMRYVPELEGVLLAHWEHEFLDDTVKIIDECPYGVCEVMFFSVIWAPKVGMKLYGTHSLSSPSHMSLLFAKTFNISIPLQHIPQDLYKFEHTDEHDDDSDSEAESDDGGVEEVGRWRNTETGLLVGEEGKKGIKFTVIGMQVNNNVLSLTGSLLADPANPPPPPTPILPTRMPSGSPSPEPEQVRPAKQARPAQSKNTQTASASAAQPQAEDVTDDRFLSARELKAKRKAEEKAKRDARKARKEERHIEDVEEAAAEDLVKTKADPRPEENLLESQQKVGEADLEREGLGKRKAKGDEGGEGSKKRKVAQV